MRAHVLVGYLVMLVVTVGGYLAIRAAGSDLVAGLPTGDQTAPVRQLPTGPLAQVLLALAAITLVARGIGIVVQRFLGQPPVIGEILAGIALGPSVLGAIAPDLQHALLPDDAAEYIGLIAKLGVVLFIFLVGLELDLGVLRGRAHATIFVAHASIVAPFLLGVALALGLYPVYATQDVGFTVFSLFLGVSMSVTAFPVLARILAERSLQQTRVGSLALASAAVGDATAWTLLTFVAGVATSRSAGTAWTILLILLFVAAVFGVVGPLLRRLAAREEARHTPLSPNVLAIVFVTLLLSGAATEFIGIHALFGSFLMGAAMRHDGRLAEQIRTRTSDLVMVVFLPAFFAYTGMRTQIGLLHGVTDWLACIAITAVATIGKFGGACAACRLVGLGWREASAIGILMNTRGLMELIVLNLGLELGVVSPTLFTMFVVMALATTFVTTPLLALVLGNDAAAGPALARTR
ncbi:MAG: cation:proton antiporter [Planctomycetota bacterium]